MKYLIFSLLVYSQISLAGYGKPILLARLSDTDAWNAPTNSWCFYSEPTMVKGKVYMPCFDEESNYMAMWDENGFQNIARVKGDHFFSNVVNSFGKASWYEYSEISVERSYEVDQKLTEIKLGKLTTSNYNTTQFRPLGNGSWFFHVKGENPELRIWKDGEVSSFFNPNVYFIFTPSVGTTGEVAFKTRDIDSSEEAPDKIWLYQNGEWKVVLEDRDANPASPWLSLRHQLSVDGGRIATIARDADGEALILIENGKTKVIARKGVDVKAFDFFTVKIRGNTIAFRADDLENRKAVYVYNDEDGLTRLITQGDIVMTDRGPGKIHYQSRDAMFYGAPGIGDNGEILQQVTLTDPDFPSTLLGIGLIKIQK